MVRTITVEQQPQRRVWNDGDVVSVSVRFFCTGMLVRTKKKVSILEESKSLGPSSAKWTTSETPRFTDSGWHKRTPLGLARLVR